MNNINYKKITDYSACNRSKIIYNPKIQDRKVVPKNSPKLVVEKVIYYEKNK